MNINKDGKTLYFSDEEIDSTQDGEKKVFVTKRINGKESHVKAVKNRQSNTKYNDFESKIQNSIFNFSDEVVIGVNAVEKEEKENKKAKKNKKKTRKNTKKRGKIKENKKLEQEDTKIKRKKVRKKKFVNTKPLIIISTVIIFSIIIIVLALTAPTFNIVQINVEGNNQVSTENIINLSGIQKGKNIFKFNKSVINNIKENAYIQDAEVTRKLPGTVIITVKERTVKYQLNLINSFVYIDRNGYLLEISDTKASVPVITGLSITEDEKMNLKQLNENDLKELDMVSKIIDSAKAIEIDNLITEINVEDKNNIILYLESEHKKIYVGDTRNLTNKMLYINKILENEKSKSGTIFVNGDIAQGFKPYFREE